MDISNCSPIPEAPLLSLQELIDLRNVQQLREMQELQEIEDLIYDEFAETMEFKLECVKSSLMQSIANNPHLHLHTTNVLKIDVKQLFTFVNSEECRPLYLWTKGHKNRLPLAHDRTALYKMLYMPELKIVKEYLEKRCSFTEKIISKMYTAFPDSAINVVYYGEEMKLVFSVSYLLLRSLNSSEFD